jgi:NAD(P)-dependent dehydrogenase (short-subunit alcohol dehydrogenase family)
MTSPAAIRDLQGNVALVTGATSGIGHATALQLAAQGATVIVHGRDASRGAAVVAEIEKSGGSARFVSAELDEPGEGLRLAEEVGDVDILINNAGFAWFGPSAKLDADTLDQLFAANVQAPYLLVSVLAPKMVARGGGVIINIASRAGIRRSGQHRRLRRQQSSTGVSGPLLGGRIRPGGVRVNAVAPGPVYTNAAEREVFDSLGETTVLGRAGEPQEIAEVIGFLASPRASYVTGTNVAVDGGRIGA